ncbi:Asp23 family, cell envelope-related function [Caloranaerobacter azorensis DSM 13643]|uniref:Asp23 family, cell envelope-related function n=1 Tax=Caloranaerobacter azorensis DSM 13643 TaxID=1121264 RepID=A0A1M5RXX2_9FIRM|nr:alkaline shock response membrane anchor protein AmaP [Caloranaerobacter azorensis]SHH31041.1 Asp23 family, cell envelope-related function [Caloranaerobacter azorensis DSM 13643]
MNIFDRIIFTIFTIFFVLISIVIIILPFDVIQNNIIDEAVLFLNSLAGNYWIILVGLVMLLVSLRLLFSGIKRNKKSEYIIKYTNLGELRISTQTIEGLTYSVTNSFNEIRDVKANIEIVDDELIILINARVSPNVNIPEVIFKIQEKVKEHVQNCSGIKVREVRFKINEIASQVRTIK